MATSASSDGSTHLNRDQVQSRLADALHEKYEIVRWIGDGGMAHVFLARHRVTGALSAIKVLISDLASDQRLVARFVAEARMATKLAGHDRILPVYDVCEENGLNFLIMPYVAGVDLATYLKARQRLTPEDSVEVILQIADGLAWASSKGVVHRDLKPSNLMINERGRILILDFGIAKAISAAGDPTTDLTHSYERLGTVSYMSPEQIQGYECDTRSDLYSLGVVFFELVTGRKPFIGTTNVAIQDAHLHTPPPNIKDYAPDVPPQVACIVKKLLEKDPANRYQSPRELIDDLNRIDFRPTDNPIPDNHKWVWIASGCVLIAVIAGIGGYKIWQYFQHRSELPAVITDKFGARMLLVKAGEFTFGGDEAGSPHEKEAVKLDSFYIDETEVSNRTYRRFCDETGHRAPESPTFNNKPNFPVTNVSFEDAEAYANWAGKRLPSEKEWEKAARGTDGRIYPWGNEPWTNAPTSIQPVLSCRDRVSPYGVYNMAGNVAEWTTSRYPIGDAEIRDMKHVLGTPNFSNYWRVIKGGYFGPNRAAERAWKTYLRRGFPQDIAVSQVIGFRCVSLPK